MRPELTLPSAGLLLSLALLVSSCSTPSDPSDQPLRLAVAANFAATLRDLTARYEAESGHALSISVGSTGALHSQIEQGAPFDLFFAADARRPELLIASGRAVAGSRRAYALGALVLWSSAPDRISDWSILTTDHFNRLAIANPETAPYGLAAQQALQATNLWQALQPRLVIGQSIGQTHQFVASGAAEVGLIALSQIQSPTHATSGSWVLVDPHLYAPIVQEMVLLNERPEARAFWSWISDNAQARAVIRSYGYQSPESP